MNRRLVLSSLLLLVQACSHRPWLHEAETGGLGNLQRYVDVAAQRHQFTPGDVRQLALAIASREVATADDPGAYDRILSLRACANELYWPLHRRSLMDDELAAAASLLLVDTGLHEAVHNEKAQLGATSGAWRAVAVRASTAADFRGSVRRALLDPDHRVRRAAVAAVQDNPLDGDGEPLLATARLDPEVSVRVAAIETLGELGDTRGLQTLRDEWGSMDEAPRLALLEAYHAPGVRRGLGTEWLNRTLQDDEDLPGVVAASLVYQFTSSGMARARLLRALQHGTASEKLVVLGVLRANEPASRPWVVELAMTSEPYVRVQALRSSVSAGIDVSPMLRRLKTIAFSSDSDAREALRVLTSLGDPVALAVLKGRLRAPHSLERLETGSIMLQLHQWDQVAQLLVDDHPNVRTTLACRVLAQLH